MLAVVFENVVFSGCKSRLGSTVLVARSILLVYRWGL
jgi:hypothetical protein